MTTEHIALTPAVIQGCDQALARAVSQAAHGDHVLELRIDGQLHRLDPAVGQVLAQVMAGIASGKDLIVGSTDALMTTTQAADQLGVSRTYVLKLMDTGVLPWERVGAHRRIPVAAVIAHRQHMIDVGNRALDEIARISRDQGLYSSDPL